MANKDLYLDIMEISMQAYTLEDIEAYYRQNKENGFKEHGFQRVVANYGILISKGRGELLKDRFYEMFNFCLEKIKECKGSNDFSVKELAFAVTELENAGLYTDKIPYWKHCLEDMEPFKHYTAVIDSPEKKSSNWTAYALAGESFKKHIGLKIDEKFTEWHLASQLMNFDENGFYHDPGLPMLYELAARSQLTIMLKCGYDGPCREKLEQVLKKPLDATLKMQSVTGEIAFGGRSQQFLFNEAYLASIMEYAAAECALTDPEKAKVYKRSARLATESILKWIKFTEGKKHNKNRYPTQDLYGCEGYAFFNKYMASLASFIYIAYFLADDTIEEKECPAEIGGFTYSPGEAFHKFFANAGGYLLEFETNADPMFDATGLGRIHKAGAPSQLMMSLPCPHNPHYTVDIKNPCDLSICALCERDGKIYTEENRTSYTVSSLSESPEKVSVKAVSEFEDGITLTEIYDVDKNGVNITVSGDADIKFNLPVFEFDGKEHTDIEKGEDFVSVVYEGYKCICKTNGKIVDCKTICANRNGHYAKFTACGKDEIKIQICINKA